MSCISVVPYPLGKEEVGGGHIPFPEGRPWCGAEGVEGAQFLMASTQSIADSAFNLPSHSQGSALSATQPLHPLTVPALLLTAHNAGRRPAPAPPRPPASLLSMEPLTGKMSSLSLFSPRSDAILHCSLLSGKFSGVTAGTGREHV